MALMSAGRSKQPSKQQTIDITGKRHGDCIR